MTYDTKPDPVILEAVNKTLENIEDKNTTETESLDSKADNATLSASPNATLTNSLLSSIDPKKASKADINEAYCRDIDSFSWEFAKPERYSSNSGRSSGSVIGIIVGVVAVVTICCLCCVCCVCKGAKDKLSGVFRNDKGNNQAGVTFSNIQEGAGPGYNGYQANQASYPPQPQGTEGLPYPVSGPPAIPPTQPGYSNYPPDYSSHQTQSPYPPNNPVPYPSHSAPYPPTNTQAPYNPGY